MCPRPAPSEPTGDHHAWRLTLESCSDPPLAFVPLDVPVYATGETSQTAGGGCCPAPGGGAVAIKPAGQHSTGAHPGGTPDVALYGRTGKKLALLVFGVTFGGFGLLAGRHNHTLLFFGVWLRGRRFYRVGHFCAGQQPESAVQPPGLRARTERGAPLGLHVCTRCPTVICRGLQLVQATPRHRARSTPCGTGTGGAENGKTITVADSLRGEAVARADAATTRPSHRCPYVRTDSHSSSLQPHVSHIHTRHASPAQILLTREASSPLKLGLAALFMLPFVVLGPACCCSVAPRWSTGPRPVVGRPPRPSLNLPPPCGEPGQRGRGSLRGGGALSLHRAGQEYRGQTASLHIGNGNASLYYQQSGRKAGSRASQAHRCWCGSTRQPTDRWQTAACAWICWHWSWW